MIYSADGAAVIDAHLTDESAHKDQFAKYLPLAGGAMTGPITRLESGTGIRPIVLTGHIERDDGVTVDRGFCAISTDPAMYTMASDGSASAVRVSQNDVQIVRSKKGATTGISVNFEQIEIGGSGSSRTVIRNVTTPSEDSDAVPKSYVDDTVKTAQPVAHLVTLAVSSWNSSAKTQTVSVADVVADESAQQILPMPAAASMSAYNDAGILCTGQGAGTLTFTADTVPTADLQVYVTITPVRFS